MALNALEIRRGPNNLAQAMRRKQTELDQALAPLRELLLQPNIEGTLIIPTQKRLIESLDMAGTQKIIEEQAGHPLDRQILRRVFDQGKKGRLVEESMPLRGVRLPGIGAVTGLSSTFAACTMNGDEIATIPFDYTSNPEQIEKVMFIVGWDRFASSVYEHGPNTNDGRTYTAVSMGKTRIPLWHADGRIVFPPKVFDDHVKPEDAGTTMTFTNGDSIQMYATILPLKSYEHIPRFSLILPADRAQYPGNIFDQAEKEGQAVLWLVKSSDVGIVKAAFSENHFPWTAETVREDREERALQGEEEATTHRHRVHFRDEKGRLFDFVNEHEIRGEKWVPKPIEGVVDHIIELQKGGLEAIYQERMKAIADSHTRKGSYGTDQKIARILTVGIGDIVQTGNSIKEIKATEALTVMKCPPVLVTFSRTGN